MICRCGRWMPEVVAAYTVRVMSRIEAFAPGLRSTVLSAALLPPTALREANRNSVAGDPYGGAAGLDQSMLRRHGTGSGHATGVNGLFHVGAFTHPVPASAVGGSSARRGPARAPGSHVPEITKAFCS